ncbi:serine hydrolase [Bernardetia sp.]|uniref:serine hydrolase n=1 Tax=Bernardetia sp. TaxID=1937974 RepID=UPI0025C5E9CB|nr:serine hydrolase [Bernardetia sp.]
MKFKIKFFFLFCFLVSTHCFAQDKQIDSLFSQYNSQSAGVAITVVKDGKIVFKKGYGLANMEYDIPITPQTVFHVASVSKQFTTFAIYLLEKEGKISLDDNVQKYIPELPSFDKPITIRHLCSHTSGLKDQWSLLTLAGWRMDDVITTEQILKMVSMQKELNFPVGTQFQYSNTGFTLLAEIVSRVSKMSFAEYVQKNIFQPLAMTNSLVYDDHQKIVKNRAYSYELEDKKYEKRKLNYSNVGATSVFTTAEDLAKWTMNFEKPIVGDPKLIERYNEISLLDDGKPNILAILNGDTIYHAKGQFVRNYRGIKLYNHTGGDAGFRSYLVRFPEKEFSVILLSNDIDFDRLGNGLKIAEFYLKDDFEPQKETVQQPKTDNSNEEVYQSDINKFVGNYYSSELNTNYEVAIKDENLFMQHDRLGTIELKRTGENKFEGIISFYVTINFLEDEKKNITGFEISNFGAKNVKFNKATQPISILPNDNPVAAQLAQAQLEAYNNGDLEKFVKPYDEDVEIYLFPNQSYGKGKEWMRENYKKLFKNSPNLHCQLVNRIVLGNTVIDHEKVSGMQGMETFEAVAIYKIENNQIKKVYFIRK